MVWSSLRLRLFSLWRWGNPRKKLIHRPSLLLVHKLLSTFLLYISVYNSVTVINFKHVNIVHFNVFAHYHLIIFRVHYERSMLLMGMINLQRLSCQARWTVKWQWQRGKWENNPIQCQLEQKMVLMFCETAKAELRGSLWCRWTFF